MFFTPENIYYRINTEEKSREPNGSLLLLIKTESVTALRSVVHSAHASLRFGFLLFLIGNKALCGEDHARYTCSVLKS